MKSRQLITLLEGHSGAVCDVEFSPRDSDLLASASADIRSEDRGGEVKLWHVSQGAEIETLRTNPQAYPIAFSRDGRQIAAGDINGLLRLWNVEHVQLVGEFPAHERLITRIDFSPFGMSILTASVDEAAKIWNQNKLTGERTRLMKHGASVFGLAASHDSGLLLSAGNDNLAKLWNVKTGMLKDTIKPEGRMDYLWAAAFSPDDKLIALGGGVYGGVYGPDRPIEFIIWDRQTHQKQVLFSGPSSDEHTTISAGTFSPDGKRVRLASTRTYTSGMSAHANYGKNFKDIPTKLKVFSVPEVEGLRDPTFSSDGQTLAVGTRDGDILLFDVTTRRCVKRLVGHSQNVMDVAFSPDGRRLATASQDSTVKLWNVWNAEMETALLTFREPRGWVWSVCFSPDGKALFAASEASENSVIHVWRAATPLEAQAQLDTERSERSMAPGS